MPAHLRRAIALPLLGLTLAATGCASGSGSGPATVVTASPTDTLPAPIVGAEVRRQVPPTHQSVTLHAGDRLIVSFRPGGAHGAQPTIQTAGGRTVLIQNGGDEDDFHFYALRSGTATVRWTCGGSGCAGGPVATFTVTVR